MRLKNLQQQQRPWVKKNFPGRLDYYPLLGVMEEVGELAHAHLKQLQGIRGTKAEHIAAKKDAIGDIVVFLSDYCEGQGFDFEDCVRETWMEVRKRDWRKNRKDGSC